MPQLQFGPFRTEMQKALTNKQSGAGALATIASLQLRHFHESTQATPNRLIDTNLRAAWA